MDLYQHREPGPARQRVKLYADRFFRLAAEGSEGEDDESAPIIDRLDGVTLDVRDLRALSAEPPRLAELAAALARVAELETELAGAKGYIGDLQHELIEMQRRPAF